METSHTDGFPRHIILPFNLRDEPAAFHNAQNRNLPYRIFPGPSGMSIDGGFLHFFQNQMPRKPWPKTVAGLPIPFASHMASSHTPMVVGESARFKSPRLAQDMDGLRMKDWTPLFAAVKAYFEAADIPITEIGNIAFMYRYEDEMGRPKAFQARHATDPTPGNPEHTEYATLQPGVRIASTYLPKDPDMFLQTTAGVLVKDAVGNEFMTTAAHGLPLECALDVMHPHPTTSRRIGELTMEIPFTGIAMVKLSEGEKFLNTTFQSDIADATQLKRLCPEGDHKLKDHAALGSPDIGCIDGASMGISYYRAAHDGDNIMPKRNWIRT